MQPWERRDTRIAAALAGLAFAVRLVQASFPRIVGADGPQFLLTAMEALQGDWATGLRDGTHPGYPCAIILFGTLVGSLEHGATLASAFFGALATVPLYAVARDMAGRRAAAVAGLLLACLPYFIVEHTEAMSEALFHFLYATALALGWFGATRASPTWYALCGFAGGLAYLTRPEGVYCAAAQVGLTAMLVVATRQWRLIAFSLGALALWIAVASPLLLWYRSEAGRWTVTKRMSLDHAVAAVQGAAEAEPPQWGRAMGRCFRQIGRTTMWVVLAFIVAGAALARGRIRPLGAAFLACLAVGYVGPPIMAAANGYPLSHRYVMPSVMFMLPFAGIAWAAAVEIASKRWDPRRVAIAASVALGVLAVAGVARGVHPREERGWAVKEAAQWLVDHGARSAVFHANTRVVGVYVGRRPERIFDGAWLAQFEPRPGEYIAIVERLSTAESRDVFARRFRLVATFPKRDDPKLDRVLIYQR